jgi:hypothetical protein
VIRNTNSSKQDFPYLSLASLGTLQLTPNPLSAQVMSRIQIAIIFVVICALLMGPDSASAAPIHYRSGDMIKRAITNVERSTPVAAREVAAAIVGAIHRRGLAKLSH